MGPLGIGAIAGVVFLAAGLAALGWWWLVESARSDRYGVPGDDRPVLPPDDRPPPLVTGGPPAGRHRQH